MSTWERATKPETRSTLWGLLLLVTRTRDTPSSSSSSWSCWTRVNKIKESKNKLPAVIKTHTHTHTHTQKVLKEQFNINLGKYVHLLPCGEFDMKCDTTCNICRGQSHLEKWVKKKHLHWAANRIFDGSKRLKRSCKDLNFSVKC